MNRIIRYSTILFVFIFLSFSNDKKIADIDKEISSYIDSAKQYLTRDDDKRKFWLDKAFQVAVKNERWAKSIEILKAQLIHAAYYGRTTQWKDLLIEIDALIETHKNELGGEAPILYNINRTQWGIYYSVLGLGFDLLALDLFKESVKELKKFPRDSANLYNLHYNTQWIASIYKKIGSYEAAIQENVYSIALYDQYRAVLKAPSKIANISGVYCEIADLYLLKSDTSQAIDYYEKAQNNLTAFLKITPTPQIWKSLIIKIYLGLSRYYDTTSQFDKSLEALLKIQSYLTENDPFIARNLMGLGDVFLSKQAYEKAFTCYGRAKQIYFNQYGFKNYRIASANLKIGRLYEQQKNWRNALHYYQQAICNVMLDFNDSSDYRVNPSRILLAKIIGRMEFLNALDGKVNVLVHLYKLNSDTALLKNAQRASDLSIDLIDSIKNDLFLDKDRQFQVADHYPIYEKAITIAEQLYQITADSRQIEKILTLSEKSKGLSLRAMFQPAFVKGEKNVTLLERERQLKYEIAKREEWLVNKGQFPNEDSIYIELQHRYNNWLQDLQEEKPAYLKFKYDPPVLSLAAIQKDLLATNQAFIEYFWGEEYFFTYLITPDTAQIWKQEIGTLGDSIEQMRALVVNSETWLQLDKSVHFQMLSHFLYKQILEKPLSILEKKYARLLVVRDGLLEYLPFELLDTSEKTISGAFSTHDFLLSHYTVSYSNSATLLHRQMQKTPAKATRNFAGFAPTYEEEVDTTDNPPLAYLTRAGQYDLQGTKDELNAITQTIGGTKYIGRNATEERFKKNASKYKILHLAMHALANDQRPDFSELLFTKPIPGSVEDGKLRAIELYNMQLNAQMVVLSACGTGYGKLQRGEGILSLGHAFTYAGTPSIVVSQWNVPDASTAEIMTSFYQNLKAGMPKDEALAQAKIAFLHKNPEMAHPFFWAGFVVLGDTSMIEFSNSLFADIFLLIALLIIAFILFLAYRKRQQIRIRRNAI